MSTTAYSILMPAPEDLSVDSWLEVEGGGLTQSIEIKLGLLPPDTPVVVALRIDNGRTVGSRQLRAIQLPQIAARAYEHVQQTLFHELDRASEWQAWADGYRDRAAAAGPDSPWSDVGMRSLADETEAHAAELKARADQIQDWLAQVADASSDLETAPRGRGAGERTEAEIKDFARVYLEESKRGARGVMTRTAKRTHMTRPNAYRWLEVARDQGLVPKKDGER